MSQCFSSSKLNMLWKIGAKRFFPFKVMAGVHFALYLKAAGSGLLLCPSISLVLKNGEEASMNIVTTINIYIYIHIHIYIYIL